MSIKHAVLVTAFAIPSLQLVTGTHAQQRAELPRIANSKQDQPVVSAEQAQEFPTDAIRVIAAWRRETAGHPARNRQIGWQGKILDRVKLADGSFTFKIELRQRLKSDVGVSYSTGYVIEEWNLSVDHGLVFQRVVEEKSGWLLGD